MTFEPVTPYTKIPDARIDTYDMGSIKIKRMNYILVIFCQQKLYHTNLETNCQKHRNVNFFLEYEAISSPSPKKTVMLKVESSAEIKLIVI